MDRTARYPHHLAKLVAARLEAASTTPPLRAAAPAAPSGPVLTRLLETLYFASLNRNEGRHTICTVHFADPADLGRAPLGAPADRWEHVRFKRPLSFDARTLTSLAKGADPAAASLAVFANEADELYIWGMVDQEVRHGENLSLDPDGTVQRPSHLQAAILGVGKLSVWVNGALVGGLNHDALVEEYSDALWSGPVHDILRAYLRQYLNHRRARYAIPAGKARPAPQVEGGPDRDRIEQELLARWRQALCRILLAMRDYKTGGGLIFAPGPSLTHLHVKYEMNYSRLPEAIWGLVETGHAVRSLEEEMAHVPPREHAGAILAPLHECLFRFRARQGEFKNLMLGAIRFIASLSCVDGFVLLDSTLAVHGFGVEARAETRLQEIYVAGDSLADDERLRRAELGLFGTRHRAMMRYCFQNPGALGFVVSQDGQVRVMTRLRNRLVVWENLDLELTLRNDLRLARQVRPLASGPLARAG